MVIVWYEFKTRFYTTNMWYRAHTTMKTEVSFFLLRVHYVKSESKQIAFFFWAEHKHDNLSVHVKYQALR